MFYSKGTIARISLKLLFAVGFYSKLEYSCVNTESGTALHHKSCLESGVQPLHSTKIPQTKHLHTGMIYWEHRNHLCCNIWTSLATATTSHSRHCPSAPFCPVISFNFRLCIIFCASLPRWWTNTFHLAINVLCRMKMCLCVYYAFIGIHGVWWTLLQFYGIFTELNCASAAAHHSLNSIQQLQQSA